MPRPPDPWGRIGCGELSDSSVTHPENELITSAAQTKVKNDFIGVMCVTADIGGSLGSGCSEAAFPKPPQQPYVNDSWQKQYAKAFMRVPRKLKAYVRSGDRADRFVQFNQTDSNSLTCPAI